MLSTECDSQFCLSPEPEFFIMANIVIISSVSYHLVIHCSNIDNNIYIRARTKKRLRIKPLHFDRENREHLKYARNAYCF